MNHFEQYITYRALDFKFSGSGDRLIDYIVETEVEKHPFKQVCAQLPIPLVERFDEALGLLNMSKREFIERALIDALDRVDHILKDVDAFEFHREQAGRQAGRREADVEASA